MTPESEEQSAVLRDDRRLILGIAVALFAATIVLRLLVPGEGEPLLLLNALPVALVALAFGLTGGLLAAGAALAIFVAYGSLSNGETLDLVGVALRAFAFGLVGASIGFLAESRGRAWSALEQSAATFRAVANESSDLISVHDSAGTCRFVSATSAHLLGYEPNELVGSSLQGHLHHDDEAEVRGVLEALATADRCPPITHRFRRGDGRYVWLETTARARRDRPGGGVIEVHAVSRDVTDREGDRQRRRERNRAARTRVGAVLADPGRLGFVYQKMIRLETGEVVGVEALARFSAVGDRTPAELFRDAWLVGRGVELERLAIRAAVEELPRLPPSWSLAVNASPATVAAPRLLHDLGDAPERVILEVTEHQAVTDATALKFAMEYLRERGVQVAIDDAGAGFSGLRRLLELRPDVLKLDISLTRGVNRDSTRGALASALTAFGDAAGITVVAEGIESSAELATLRGLGVRVGQGYFLHRPAPLKDLLDAGEVPRRSGLGVGGPA